MNCSIKSSCLVRFSCITLSKAGSVILIFYSVTNVNFCINIIHHGIHFMKIQQLNVSLLDWLLILLCSSKIVDVTTEWEALSMAGVPLSVCTCQCVRLHLSMCPSVLVHLSVCTCQFVRLYLSMCPSVLVHLSVCAC